MAKKRMIDSRIRKSMSFAALDHRQRDLWHGLITVADDQGRVYGTPANVRSEVWPMDDIDLEQVAGDLAELASHGMIVVYQVENKVIIQIVNWWKYQAKQWAIPSDWPPPQGWVDRTRYHGRERKIIQENWDQDGGFADKNHLNDYLEVKVDDYLEVKVENQVENYLDHSDNDNDSDNDKEVKEDSQEQQEQAPATDPAPVNLDAWLEQLKSGSNKPAILRTMIETLYPEAVEYPEYSYIGSVAKKVGGAGRLAALLWEIVPRRPTGDILSYVQAMTRNQKKQDEPAGFEGLREYAEEQGFGNGN